MSKISIIAVGDISPGDQSIMGQGVLFKTLQHGVDYPFNGVREILSQSDILIGNLEGVLSSEVKKASKSELRFCGIPEFAGALSRTGFNVINISNNHVFEHGPQIFNETLKTLMDAGIYISGLRSISNQYYTDPVIKQVNEKSIGIIGYNWIGIDKFPNVDAYISQSRDSIVNYSWNRNTKQSRSIINANMHVINDIKRLRAQVDYVILLTHWGYEYVTCPPNGLINEARSFIDNGADIIIGCHPHVLQGFERYKHGMIFYSLGNFIFDSRRTQTRSTAILKLTLHNRGEYTYEFIPCMINSHFQPEQATEQDSQKILSIINKSSECIQSEKREVILNDNNLYREYEKFYNLSKIYSIFHHLIAIKNSPSVLKQVLKKTINLVHILLIRLKGRKIRW